MCLLIGWERGSIQPHSRCNNRQKRQTKGFDALRLVRHVKDGSYRLHDLSDKLMYLGKEIFNSLCAEGTIDNDVDLGKGHWCIIKTQAADNLGEYILFLFPSMENIL